MAKKGPKLDEILKKAKDALEKKNYDLAIVHYLRAVTIDPANIDARAMLRATQIRRVSEGGKKGGLKGLIAKIKAKILVALKKYREAILACENALTFDPEDVSMMELLATCAAQSELLPVAAWQRQEIADKHDPENTGNLWALAECYRELKEAAKAIAILQKIKEIDPSEDVDPQIREISAELSSEIYSEAVQKGSRAVVASAEETERLELDAGRLRSDDQRLKAIAYRLAHDLVERPKDHRIWMTIGDIASEMDDWNEGYKRASEYYAKALEINPSDSSIRDKIGNLEIKKFNIEIEALKAKAEKDPDAKKELAALRAKLAEYETKEYERRVKAQPLKAEFHFRLGQLYFQAKRLEEAIGELQQATKDPKFKLRALTTLGRCFLESDQLDMAIAQFEKARASEEVFAKYREPLYYLAQALEKKGDLQSLKAALEHYTHIYEQEITYRDVKQKVPALQKKIKELGG